MIKIKEFINLDSLQKIQDQLSELTNLAAVTVNMEGEFLTKQSNFTDFCVKYTRASEEGLKKCIKCNKEATGVYICHAGLMNFSEDILIEGEKVGKVIGGQIFSTDPDPEKFRQMARELGIDEDTYLKALDKVPRRSEKTIRMAAQMFGEIINQLVNLEYRKNKDKKKVDIFNEEFNNVLEAVQVVKAKTEELQRVASMENMLSINASIEAGRAGEAGVGFAVVAKKLGEISKDSADVYTEIGKKILTIEKSMQRISQIN